MIFLRVLGFFVYFFTVFSSSFSVLILVSKLNQLVIFLLLFSILLFRGTLSYKLTKNRKLFAARSVFRILVSNFAVSISVTFVSMCVCVCFYVLVAFLSFNPSSELKKRLLDLYWVRVLSVCVGFVFRGKICFIKIFVFFTLFLLLLRYGLLWYVVSLRRKSEILIVLCRFKLCLGLCECDCRKRVRKLRTRCECLESVCVSVYVCVERCIQKRRYSSVGVWV